MTQAQEQMQIPELLNRIGKLENNLTVQTDYNKLLDKKLDKALEDRIVLRNENYKLKEKLNTQTRTHTTHTEDEECLTCSA